MSNFRAWMESTSVEEKKELAIKARTSLNMLYQLSAGHRRASADLAGKIEAGIASMAKRKRAAVLPAVQRGDLCEACSKCKYYKKV